MPVNFPGAIPPPRQNPYPTEPLYGNMTSDIGQGLRQTGDDLMQFDRTLDEKAARQAKLQDMIERRKQALAVQAAREEYQRKTLEFNKAKEDQDIEESKRIYDRGVKEYDDTAKAKKDEIDRKEKIRMEEENNRSAARQQVLAYQEKHGKPAGREMTRRIALANNVKDWTKLAGDKPHKPSSAGTTRKLKKEQYRNLLPRLNRQLESLVADMNRAIKGSYTRSQLIQSMSGLDSRIETVPDERGKRTYLRQKQEVIRKKIEEIDKIQSYLDTPDVGSAVDRVDEYTKAEEELNAINEVLNAYPDSTGAD